MRVERILIAWLVMTLNGNILRDGRVELTASGKCQWGPNALKKEKVSVACEPSRIEA